MNKIPKIAVSFLLILSLILNPFASALDIRANAVAGEVIAAAGLTFLIFVVNSIFVAVSGEAVEEIDEATKAYLQNHYEEIQQPIEAGGSPIVFESRLSEEGRQNLIDQGHLLPSEYPVVASIDPSASLTDAQREFYEKFVEEFNDAGIVAVENFNSGYVPSISASDYSKVKNNVLNSFFQQAAAEANKDMISNGVVAPVYDFDFVGPLPHMQFHGGTTISTSTMAGGFVYTSPLPSSCFATKNASAYPLTEELASSIGADGYGMANSYCDAYWSRVCYGASRYCLFNGKLYFKQAFYYSSTASNHVMRLENPYYYPQYFISADGTSLTQDGFTADSPCSIGLAFNMTNEYASSIPIKTTLTEDEFTTTTDDKIVEIPRTEEENIIGQAIGLGLINPDSVLELNEDGTIAGADGMTLAKLQELIDMIAEGQLDFENIQEYLDLITKLIASGNYTAAEQKVILDNIEALNQASAKSLEEINASVLAISQALTLEGELEDVDTEFSYLDVEHTGLVEAETIVNTALPIVGQAKQLVTNVFNSVDESSEVPNFNFYWDSNKDGEVEKYNFFDLSFMEQPLTNANLEDKSRFTDVMTVREFIQYIIIFVVYAGYLIKLLRRIPGLLGGSEGMADDVNTINSNRG